MPWLLWLLACYAPTPDLAPPPGPSAWYRVDLAGVPVGAEERRVVDRDRGRQVWRRSRVVLRVGGQVTERVTTSVAQLAADGSLGSWVMEDGSGRRSWQAEGEHPVWLLELAVPEGRVQGQVWALDPWSGEAREVTVAGGRWTMDGLTWQVEPDGLRGGPVVVRQVDTPPELEPVDPVALLWRAAEVPAGLRTGRTAGRASRATFEVDGVVREVRSPLALEIGAEERRILRGWMDRAARAAVEGGGGALQALWSGPGDCKAQAAALVEVAQGEGRAARQVHGLVWLDGPLGAGLVPHAWVEVELGDGQVIAVDPALGQLPADATHLPLTPAEVLGSEVRLLTIR